jgi:hypothetical protein
MNGHGNISKPLAKVGQLSERMSPRIAHCCRRLRFDPDAEIPMNRPTVDLMLEWAAIASSPPGSSTRRQVVHFGVGGNRFVRRKRIWRRFAVKKFTTADEGRRHIVEAVPALKSAMRPKDTRKKFVHRRVSSSLISQNQRVHTIFLFQTDRTRAVR